MEYSEEHIAEILQQWKTAGYTDTIIVDHGLLLAINSGEYFAVKTINEDIRVNFYDEFLSGSAWSMHALTLGDSCRGILILGGDIYNPWELTSEIREMFDMPHFSSDNIRMAA